MKTGVSMFSFTEDADLKHLFPLIKKAGYDGVEPVFSEYGYLNEKTSKEDIREIGKIAREEGLEIPSVGLSGSTIWCPTRRKPEEERWIL